MADIVTDGGDKRTAELVWEALTADLVVEGFTPYPDDSLEYVYGFVDEELDEDLIVRALVEQGLPLPSTEVTQEFGEINTPRRVAQFVRACRILTGRESLEGEERRE